MPDPGKDVEIVTVFHDKESKQLAEDLIDSLAYWEPGIKVHAVDNTRHDRGLAKACNLGAVWCTAPVVGFLSPEVQIKGTFAGRVVKALEDPEVVVVNGGSCLFVRREWFESVDGFDEHSVWSGEETDLAHRAKAEGRSAEQLRLPITNSFKVWKV